TLLSGSFPCTTWIGGPSMFVPKRIVVMTALVASGLLPALAVGDQRARSPFPAQPIGPDGAPDLPPAAAATDLRDPAFDRYVDLAQVGEALASQNAGFLIDLALQLAEGERILQRPHKAMSAARVLKLAIRLAGEKKDKPTLDRLARVVKARGDKELGDMLDKLQTLAAGSRQPGPAWLTALDQLEPETLRALKSARERTRRAKVRGDVAALKALDNEVTRLAELEAAHKSALKTRIAEALAALPEKAEPDAEVLGKLVQSSRGAPPPAPMP